MNPWISRALLLAALTSFVACGGGGGDDDEAPAIPGAKSGVVFGLTGDNRLVSFDPGTPTVLISNRTITGLATGEEVVVIDFRPSTGELYGFSDQGRLYRINTSTGASTQIGTTPLTPALTGTEIGFDFNPVVDLIRLTTDADENLRLHPDTGAIVGTDTPLAYVVGDDNSGTDPQVTAVAYTNSFAGAGVTTLYGLDVFTNDLVRVGSVNGTPNSPNTGQLNTIGPQLGTLNLGTSGFDISPSGGAYAVGTTTGATTSKLFSISLTTGGADAVGNIGSDTGADDTVRDLAVAPPTAPLIWALAANNRIVSFRPGTPGTLVSDEVVDSSDLQQSETIVAIDIRPSTGELYGLGSTSRLYKIDKDDNPNATLIGTTAFSPALNGTVYDMDFNPTSDLLRVVSDTDQNLVLNPTTGVNAAIDTAITYAAGDPSAGLDPNLGAIAYTNNFSGSATTTVFGIDSDQDNLVMLGSANGTPNGPGSGLLTTVGSLAIDTADEVGLDFSAYGAAWAVTMSNPGVSTLYVISTTTGLATPIGAVGGSVIAIDLAVDIPFLPLIVGLTTDNRLVTFRPGALGATVSSTAITGLAAGETVLAIDFRPSTSELYAVGSTSRLYRIDRTSAVVTAIGVPFVPLLDGTEVGMDFNPIFDPVRVVTAGGQNLRVNPTSGAIALDAMLAFAAGDPNELALAHVTAIAYDSNFTGTAATTVWGIDTNLVPPALVRIGSVNGTPNSANTGLVSTIGPLTGVDTSDLAGFDISTYGGGFLVLNPAAGTTSALYSVNLATGAPRLLGNITAAGATTRLRDIAILPNGL